MSYNKTNWLDRAVQYPQRFTRTSDGTYDTLVPAPGTVAQSGTPITAAALNNMENGISNNDTSIISLLSRAGKLETDITRHYISNDSSGAGLLTNASAYLMGTTTANANFLLAIQDTGHAGKYIIAVGHFQKDSICEFTTIVAKTLTYLYNTIGTVTVNGLSGDARFTVICLS
jgi:hypothetical protein